MVIEDTENGIASAKNANMACIAIPNKFTKSHDYSKADIILNSIKELNEEIISGL